jgi:hypothetical protein
MGRQYSVEEEKDLTLPEDSIHRARLVEIKERDFTFTDRNTVSRRPAPTLSGGSR